VAKLYQENNDNIVHKNKAYSVRSIHIKTSNDSNAQNHCYTSVRIAYSRDAVNHNECMLKILRFQGLTVRPRTFVRSHSIIGASSIRLYTVTNSHHNTVCKHMISIECYAILAKHTKTMATADAHTMSKELQLR
jgi:hypothetical protein